MTIGIKGKTILTNIHRMFELIILIIETMLNKDRIGKILISSYQWLTLLRLTYNIIPLRQIFTENTSCFLALNSTPEDFFISQNN